VGTPSVTDLRRAGRKPPYELPTAAQIASGPSNGMTCADLFAGCGAAALGYRWAGFDVRWANEIAAPPRSAYAANLGHEPDPRDVREVQPSDVLDALGIDVGELDLLTGSPPCTAFSLAGVRDRGWGRERSHAGVDQTVDDLFFEFGRLLEGLRPRAFAAENVTGLVRGRARGYFKLIMDRLRDTGYAADAAILDASWLGVPQARQRVFIIGVRDDLGVEPEFPDPLPYRYSVRDALGEGLAIGGEAELAEVDITRFAIGPEWDALRPGGKSDRYFSLARAHPDRPAPTLTAAAGTLGAAAVTHPTQRRKFTKAEMRRLSGMPDDFALPDDWGDAAAAAGNCVPPPVSRAVGARLAALLR
jgi:DNA (cytosine-5)-methyltransferase 1